MAKMQSEAALHFGAALRAQRERRQVSLASIAESTKILAALLDGLENGDVARWPSGLYRRSFIRAYAVAIGLDPEPVVREFLEHFPDPDDRQTPAIVGAITPSPTRAPWTTLRLTLADTSALGAGPIIRELRRRLSAMAVDAFVLSVLGLGLFLVLGSFWAPLCIAAGCYFFGSILILGNTPGVCLFAMYPTPSSESPFWSHARRLLTGAFRRTPEETFNAAPQSTTENSQA